jgi:hypothetical protein
MARWRQAIELAMTDEEIASLTTISRSRTEPARRVERAQMAARLNEGLDLGDEVFGADE